LLGRVLDGDDGVLRRLAVDHPILLVGFSSQRSAQDPFSRLIAAAGPTDLEDDSPEEGVGPLDAALTDLAASGFGTDIARAVRDALERTRGQRVAGVVLVTDGQVTADGGQARLAAAMELASDRPVPVYAVMVGDPTPRKNLTVLALDGPDRVRRTANVELVAMIAHRNLEGQQAVVRLQRRPDGQAEWADTNVSATVDLDGVDEADDVATVGSGAGQRTLSVTLTVRPEELGAFEYRAVIDPRPDEHNPDDNASGPLRVQVTDEKINILLISGDAGWEFQYLKNFLIRADQLYRVSVWQQSADPEVNQVASTGMKLTRLPRELTDLIGTPDDDSKPGYQVVILIDPKPTDGGFDGPFVEMLKAYVSRHGGGLCYVAGNKYTAAVCRELEAFTPLASILPVRLGPNMIDLPGRIASRRPTPWPIRLTGYGRDHQVTRLAGSARASEETWNVLPGIFWSHPVERLKPGARVLAEHPNPSRRTDQQQPEPLLAVQSPGTGRVAYLGFESTWRWRLVRNGYYHRRFWANVVRYLASAGAGKRVTISTGGERFAAGQTIDVEVEAYDEAFAPETGETFEVILINVDTGDQTPITLAAMDRQNQPGIYSGQIDPTLTAQRGTYRVTALPDHPHAEQIVAAKEFVIELPQAEAFRKEADEATMRLIGSSSLAVGAEGGFVGLHDVAKLGQWIPPDRKQSIQELPRELWDSRLTLILVVVLLTAEWILRKRHNLA